MSERPKRHFLKAKESKKLLDKASKRLGANVEQALKDKANVEVVQAESARIILIDGKPALTQTGEEIYPTLTFTAFIDNAPKVTVDMGAIPYVCKGANVMAPGIRGITGEFRKGDIVVVTDEKHGKPIALGEALYDSTEARNLKQGIVIKNVQHVGDNIWNHIRQLNAGA